MKNYCRSFLIGVLSLVVGLLPLTAQAGIVSTASFNHDQVASAPLAAEVVTKLQRDEVQAMLTDMGVDASVVEQRVAQLSAAELSQLNQKLDQMPAGSGLAGVVGVVFIVLIILELVGVTNIFTAF